MTRNGEALAAGGRGERIRVRLAGREILEARIVGEGRLAVDFKRFAYTLCHTGCMPYAALKFAILRPIPFINTSVTRPSP